MFHSYLEVICAPMLTIECIQAISRTNSITCAMKSSALAFLLASMHFPQPLARVPPAASAVWVAIIGPLLATFWSFRGDTDEGRTADGKAPGVKTPLLKICNDFMDV